MRSATCLTVVSISDDDYTIGAFGDVPVKQALQARKVERAVVLHRREYGGNGTLYGLHERIRNRMPQATAGL
jgi:hypothetical protein